MIYVAIVEDNKIAAELLREYVEQDDIKINAVYNSAEDALEGLFANPLPDVVLVDIGLPGISGIELTKILKEKTHNLEIMIQSVFEDTNSIVSAIKAGASGYILKASSRMEISYAIKEVKNGGSFLSGKIARRILQEFKSMDKNPDHEIADIYSLTAREEEILKELIRGKSYKEISSSLNISSHTVNNHIRKIYEKMRVNSRGEAVAKALGSDKNGNSHQSGKGI